LGRPDVQTICVSGSPHYLALGTNSLFPCLSLSSPMAPWASGEISQLMNTMAYFSDFSV
jgi:hypothetical protein